MKNGIQVLSLLGLGIALSSPAFAAEDKPAAAPAAAATFKDDKEKASYAVGMTIGNNIKRSGLDLDVDAMAAAMKDVMAGRETKMTPQQSQEAINNYQRESQRKAAEKNKEAGAAFLAANKAKPGVKTHTVTLADGTTAELQYKVITDGTGAMPKTNDTVTVNYRGTLINGTEFDSSAKHGQPGKFNINRVVKGWTEALQLMKSGSKWELYLPASLAYGDSGFPPAIEPGASLIFEIELIGIDTPAPLTSDIIRVPSAEELKKGAKVEVLKAEDVEKQIKAAAATNQAPKQ